MMHVFAHEDEFGGITIRAACLAEDEADPPQRPLIDSGRRGGPSAAVSARVCSALETAGTRRSSSVRAATDWIPVLLQLLLLPLPLLGLRVVPSLCTSIQCLFKVFQRELQMKGYLC